MKLKKETAGDDNLLSFFIEVEKRLVKIGLILILLKIQ